MTISTTDIKLRTPERLTDLPDGGRVIAAWGARLGRADPQSIVDGIADAFLSYVIAETHEHDKRIAAQAAADAVQEIIATPT